jgi:hypothetical protein
MEDILGDLPFFIIYIDDILVCSKDLKEHKKHIELFCQRIYHHDLVLSPTKMEIAKTKFEFLGLYVTHGMISL